MKKSILQPTSLNVYRGLPPCMKTSETCIDLEGYEIAAILQAHDYGIASLPPESIELLDRVMSKLKQEIWP